MVLSARNIQILRYQKGNPRPRKTEETGGWEGTLFFNFVFVILFEVDQSFYLFHPIHGELADSIS